MGHVAREDPTASCEPGRPGRKRARRDRPFQFPQYIALDESKTAYITDNYAKAVWKVPAGGAPEKLVEGEPLVGPVGITRAGGKLYVTDPKAKAVFQIEADGKVTKLVPGA